MEPSKRVATPEHPALPLMREIADRVILAFRADLEIHDASTLRGIDHGRAFVWVAYTGGTVLSPAGPARRTLSVAAMAEMPGAVCYLWDGESLTEHSVDALTALLADHEESLRRNLAR